MSFIAREDIYTWSKRAERIGKSRLGMDIPTRSTHHVFEKR